VVPPVFEKMFKIIGKSKQMTATTTTATTTARLVEVFSAIQGEGLNVGTRQIFIRFALCDLRCHFCDSSNTWHTPNTCRIECNPGLRDFEVYSNPVTLSMLLHWVERQNIPNLHDSISLTGGEPLLHASFLVEFLPQVRSLTQLPIYLETGGHRSEQLAMVLPYLDSVGMDFKLESVSGEKRLVEHTRFLQLCHDAKVEVFVKIIVSASTSHQELEQAAQIVASTNPSIPIFLQPVTPLISPTQVDKPIIAPLPEQILVWQADMKRIVKHVRVIPQTHKMLNQL
jgi:7-carboxy-7-deazaguanine synthase